MEESEQDLRKLARWLAKIQARDFFLMGAQISLPDQETFAPIASPTASQPGWPFPAYAVWITVDS